MVYAARCEFEVACSIVRTNPTIKKFEERNYKLKLMENNQTEEESKKKATEPHSYPKLEVIFIGIISIFLFIVAVFAF